MVTVKPEPTDTAETQEFPEPNWSLVGELRLNLSALGVDHLAEDFGERLCQLSSDNPGWQFEYSAQGELIVMAPPGSESSGYEMEVAGMLYIWRTNNDGMSYGPTIGFRLHTRAIRIPDAAWIAQERYDNSPRRNGAEPSTARPTSSSRFAPAPTVSRPSWPRCRNGWTAAPAWAGASTAQRHVYVYRLGQTGPELLEDPGDFVRWRRPAGVHL